jgi:hypothetical protein
MRLNEFADPSPYRLSTEDAENFLKRLERIWPNDEFRQRSATVIPRSPSRRQHRQHPSSNSPPRSVTTVRAVGRPLVVVR